MAVAALHRVVATRIWFRAGGGSMDPTPLPRPIGALVGHGM